MFLINALLINAHININVIAVMTLLIAIVYEVYNLFFKRVNVDFINVIVIILGGIFSILINYNQNTMERLEAIKILMQVAVLAQQKGALSLDDAVVVKTAIDTLIPEVEEYEKSKKETNKEEGAN